MEYHPTAAQKKQDLALRAALDKFSAAYCAAETQTVACSMPHGGTRRERTTASRRRAEESGSEAETEAPREQEMIDTPSHRRNTRRRTSAQPTIREQASAFCDDPENYGEYETMAKLVLIGGTIGVAATGLGGVFAAYSNTLVGVLGLPSIANACGTGSYFQNELLSKVVPGVQSCVQVTATHERLAATAWGSLVTLGAMFKIPLPGELSTVPARAVEAIARALCRYYKERELDQEMRTRFVELASQMGPGVRAQVDEAARVAMGAQAEQLAETHSGRRSPRRSASPVAEIAASVRRSATPEHAGGKRRTRRMRARKHSTRKGRGRKTARHHKKNARKTRRR